jgi:hypothetical protein
MSRFVLLALVAVGSVTAGAAVAKPPTPQPVDPGAQPVDPAPAGLCSSYPHPLAACSAVAVRCPSTAKAQFACKTVAVAGPANAAVRKLELVLPRRYVALTLLCRTKTGVDITCRVSARTSTTVAGLRVYVLKLPDRSGSLRIGCATGKSAFACKLRN